MTAVTSNMAVLGNGTDTGNSIRMPSATSGVIGVFPTRGLVSIAGIAPLDWLLDNTGPIARNVTDAAIALAVMAGEDPLDPPTAGLGGEGASPAPTRRYLKADALKGRRFGVPAFILDGHGVAIPWRPGERCRRCSPRSRRPMQANRAGSRDARRLHEGRRGTACAGATVVMDDTVLPDSFARHRDPRQRRTLTSSEGTDLFLGLRSRAISFVRRIRAVDGPAARRADHRHENVELAVRRHHAHTAQLENDPDARGELLRPRAAD